RSRPGDLEPAIFKNALVDRAAIRIGPYTARLDPAELTGRVHAGRAIAIIEFDQIIRPAIEGKLPGSRAPVRDLDLGLIEARDEAGFLIPSPDQKWLELLFEEDPHVGRAGLREGS